MPENIRDKRFYLTALLFLIVLVMRTMNGVWGGDFWEHCAVNRELATHLFAPRHPLLNLDVPHPFFSPYSLFLALVTRFSGAHPVATLSAAGIFNFVLLLLSMDLFLRTVFGTSKVSFYAVLCILFLWGTDLLDFSGFFHWNVLGYVLPYPSTFCMGLAFIVITCCVFFFRQGGLRWAVVIVVLNTFILLSHPVSAMTAYAGMFAVLISCAGRYRPFTRSDALVYVLLLVLPVLMSLAWPYYSFVQLMTRVSSSIHQDSYYPYEKLLQRTFPALVALPVLWGRFRQDKRDMLFWMFALLLTLFLWGKVSGAYSYSRALSPMMIILQVCAAQWLMLHEHLFLRRRTAPLILAALVSVAFLIYCRDARAFKACLPGSPDTYSGYTFLSRYTRQYDTVLADMAVGWPVPSFGGKIVAALHPQPFVPDHEQRCDDVRLFFSGRASPAARGEIIRKYGVDYLLLNKELRGSLCEDLEALGRVMYRDELFTLVALSKD